MKEMITTSYMSLSLGLVRCRDESDDIFKREPADKDCFGDLKEVLLPWKKKKMFLCLREDPIKNFTMDIN